MAELSAGTAYLQILPSLAGFGDKVRAELKAIGAGLELGVRLTPETSALDAEIDKIKARIQALNAAHAGPKIDAEISEAQDRIRQLEIEIKRLSKEPLSVKVLADIGEAQDKIAELQARIHTLRDLRLKVTADVAEAEGKLAALEAQRAGVSKPVVIPVKVQAPSTAPAAGQGAAYGGAFGDAMRARIDAALKALPTITLTANATDVDTKLAEIRGRLDALRNKTIGVDIAAGAALTELAAIKADLDVLAAKSVDVQVKVDAAKAGAELAGLKGAITALDGANVAFKVDDGGSAAKASSGLSGLMAAGIALAPAIIPVAAAVAAALAAIGLAAVAAAANLVVLKMAFSGVGAAATALENYQQNSTATNAAWAQQQQSSANSVISAHDGVRNAIRGVDDAQRASGIANTNAANAVTAAQRGVADAYIAAGIAETSAARAVANAQQALGDAYIAAGIAIRSATQAVASAEQALERAEQSLANAQRQVTTAQNALTDARLSATRALASYVNQVKDGALAERGAIIGIAEAKLALDKVLANPRATQLMRDDAQLIYDTSVQHLTDIKEKNKNLAEDKAAADKKGVEGSNAVVSAQNGLISANQAVASAQQSIANAQQQVANATANLAETQRASAEKIAKAQEALGVAEAAQAETKRANTEKITVAQQALRVAEAAQSETARAGAESVVKAQEAVVTSQRALTAALAAQQAQMLAGDPALKALNDAMEKLSPTGREFVRFLVNELQPKMRELTAAAQNGLLPGLEAGIRATFPLWPQLSALVGSVATAMGDMARQVGEALNNPFWKGFVTFLTAELGPSTRTFLAIVGNVITGMAGIFEAFGPIFNKIGADLLSFSAKFSTFGQTLASNKQFQEFLQYAKENGPVIMQMMGDLFLMFMHLGIALAPLGAALIQLAAALAKVLAAVSPQEVYLIATALASLANAITWLLTNVPGLSSALAIAIEAGGLFFAAKWIGNLTGITTAVKWIIGRFAAVSLSAVAEAVVTKASWVAAEAAILLESATKGAKWLAAKLLQFAAASASAILEAAATAGAWVAAQAAMLVDLAVTGAAWLASWIAKGAAAAASSLLEAGIALGAWLVASAGMLLAMAPIVLAIAALIAIGVLLYKNWDTIKAAAAVVWSALKEGWNALWAAMKAVYEAVIKPVFEALKTFIVTTIPDAFKAGIGLIKAAWNLLSDIAKAPVNFVINTVYNAGIVPLWNGIASVFGLGTLKPATPLAEGGVLPGYAPGQDSVFAMLSPGEGILVPEAVQGLGAGFVHDMNRHYSGGRSSGGLGSSGVTGFAAGGVVDTKGAAVTVPGAWDIISGLFTDPVASVKKLFAGVLEASNRIPGKGLLHDGLGKIPFKIIDSIVEAAKKMAAAAISAVTSGISAVTGALGVGAGSGAGTEKWRGVGLQALGIAGQGAENITKLLMQMGTESGGRTSAINRTDINWTHGTPSVGLMQVIGPTYAKWHHPSYNAAPFEYAVSEDPLSNILASIRYTVANYGSLSKGWQGHGYDAGGWLPPGKTLAYNDTGRWERILTAGEWDRITDQFERLSGRGRRGYDAEEAGANGQPITIHVNPGADRDESEIATMVSRRLSFAMRCGA